MHFVDFDFDFLAKEKGPRKSYNSWCMENGYNFVNHRALISFEVNFG